MISDLSNPENARPRKCDLLILGSGPAGITLAVEVARARPGLRIVLAEAGGLEPSSPEELDLYRGRSAGIADYPAGISRLRYFGGSSGHWGGWVRPLEPIVFEARPDAGMPGWPIGAVDLAAHYAAAHRWLEVTDDDYGIGQVSPELRSRLLDFGDSRLFENRLFRFSPPTRYGQRYRSDVADAADIDCLLNAAAVGYRHQDDRLLQVTLGGLHGNRSTVDAGQVVCAMGGIESTRHLLVLHAMGWTAAGLTSPWLGRGFADHTGLQPGILELPTGRIYQRTRDHSDEVMPVVCPTPEALRARGWHHCCMLLQVLPDAPGLPTGYSRHRALGFRDEDFRRYGVTMILEPRPNPDSRIELDTERDALDLPRPRIHWQPAPEDYLSALDAYRTLGIELGRLGLGRARVDPLDVDALRRSAAPVFHHMGTLRMASGPDEGVVDADLKVFGTRNLYVLSSAVFPSYCFSNPTMTIVALAHRLASHLVDVEFAR